MRAARLSAVSSGPMRIRPLLDHRPAIQLRRHEVHAGAVGGLAIVQRALVRAQPAVQRQQRGVDVEHAPGIALHEFAGQHPHEARQHDGLGAAGVNGAGQGRIELRAVGIVAVVDHRTGNSVLAGDVQRAHAGAVAQHQAHLAADLAALHGIQDGRKVAPGAGDQHRQPAALHR